jgi:glycosyltransferase involved in cell wall biosynthesis
MRNFLSNNSWDKIARDSSIESLKEYIMTGGSKMQDLPFTPLHLINTDTLLDKILDFGCGIGRNFNYYNKISREVHGYDLPHMVKRCSSACSEKINLLTSDWDEISSNHYDVVAANFVFQHFLHPNDLKELLSELKNMCTYLYVSGRNYMDDKTNDNVFKLIHETPHFECVKSSASLETVFDIQYPKDESYHLLFKSDTIKNSPVKLISPNEAPLTIITKSHTKKEDNLIDIGNIQLSENVIFTIADDNYFHKAKVLIKSINEFAPDCDIVKVSVNEENIDTTQQDKVIELGFHDIDLPKKAADQWTRPDKYGDKRFITTLCTAIKPSMFNWCFNRGAKRVLYIDPDCELYGNIDYLFEQLMDNECILFPHFLEANTIASALSPPQWEGRHDFLALRVGVYNCGMVGFASSNNSINTIRWWEDRILYDCEDTHENFTFTDQSWGSLMPGFVKTKVVRLPEYNAAWWNNHERQLVYEDGYKINENPLKVYHFSGYEIENPTKFSRHHICEIPEECRRLFLDYSKKIISADDVRLYSYGYYDHTSGHGGAAKDVSNLLQDFGVKIERKFLGQPCDINKDDPKKPKVSLWFSNADTLEKDISEYSDGNNQDHRIAYWAWELDEPPDYIDEPLEEVDELWVPSTFCKKSFAKKFNKDIVVVPSFSYKDYMYKQRPAPDNEKITFLFTYDTRSSWERKNPYGLIRAFKMAFHPSEAKLIIKVLNLNETPEHKEELHALVGQHDIEIIDKLMNKKSYLNILKGVDAYVSLHRSEGLGKTIIEAMSYGIPVITTAYGGHMDINTERNSMLVPFDMIKIENDIKILNHTAYKAGNQWANPSVEEAASAMRMLYADDELRNSIGQTAREDIWRLLNPTLFATMLIKRLRRAQWKEN